MSEHGTVATYNSGCRCAACKTAYSSYKRRWLAMRSDAQVREQRENDRQRKLAYGGTCDTCGGPTTGSNGRAKAPKRCLACVIAALPEPKHGTRARYVSKRFNCRCDDCCAANRAELREDREKRRGKEPPVHGYSGYISWDCRCDVCSQAMADRNALAYRMRRLRAQTH